MTLGNITGSFEKVSDMAGQLDAGTVLMIADQNRKCVDEVDTRTLEVVQRCAAGGNTLLINHFGRVPLGVKLLL